MPAVLAAALLSTLCAGGVTRAADVPLVRPGLWQVQTTLEGNRSAGQKGTPPTLQAERCIGANTTPLASVEKIVNASRPGKTCGEATVAASAGRITYHRQCTITGAGASLTETFDVVYAGDFASHYSVAKHVVGGRGFVTDATDELTRIGECPAGMAPGDSRFK